MREYLHRLNGRKNAMGKILEEKIYSMSNSFLPLDVFYNDIRDNKDKNYNKESAYKDLEKIADFIIDLQSQLDQANERLKGAIIPRYKIGTKLYMIPTEFNRLKGIKDYELLSISLSPIGLRYNLCLNKKEKGVEPFYCASEDMFGQSIFSTLEEAQAKLQELRGGK